MSGVLVPDLLLVTALNSAASSAGPRPRVPHFDAVDCGSVMTSMMAQFHRVMRICMCGASAPDRRLVRVGEGPRPGVRWPVFGSLDYIYVPAADVDGEVLRYVQTLGAELVWKVRGMGTTVACLRVGESGPAILLSGHLRGQGAILVYRVPDYAATVAQLRARNLAVRELEIPHGPCATFTMEAGQRYAVYQLVRPDAVHLFDGRIDP
jgi:hypothetical protein